MIIVGRKPVMEALKEGVPLRELIVYKGNSNSLNKELDTARAKRVKITFATKERLAKLSAGAVHQGIAARIREPEPVSVEDIAQNAHKRGRNGLVLILDEIQDPQNTGALIRSALAAGANGVVMPERRSSPPITTATVKASAGAVLKMPIALETNLVAAIEKLKKLKFWIYGADNKGGVPYYDADFADNVALVMGSEGKGLRKLIRQKCDFILNIPISPKVESLNVSAAGAILLFEIARKKAKIDEKRR